MSSASGSYGRLQRLLDRVGFSWGASGGKLTYIDANDLWMVRFRPGGPHALWIAGHLAFYEGAGRRLYEGLDKNPLAEWQDLFSNGSPCLDDASAYPEPSRVLSELRSGREHSLGAMAQFDDARLDSPVENERLAIKDLQSQIEFMVWHDAHHGAQLGAIVSNHKASQG